MRSCVVRNEETGNTHRIFVRKPCERCQAVELGMCESNFRIDPVCINNAVLFLSSVRRSVFRVVSS